MTVPVNLTMNRVEGGSGDRVELRVQHNHPQRLLRAYLTLEVFANLLLGRNVRVDADVAAPACAWKLLEDSDAWETSCASPVEWTVFHPEPRADGYLFCPSCGGRIESAKSEVS